MLAVRSSTPSTFFNWGRFRLVRRNVPLEIVVAATGGLCGEHVALACHGHAGEFGTAVTGRFGDEQHAGAPQAGSQIAMQMVRADGGRLRRQVMNGIVVAPRIEHRAVVGNERASCDCAYETVEIVCGHQWSTRPDAKGAHCARRRTKREKPRQPAKVPTHEPETFDEG
jgi:hypothetical protein